MNGDQLARWRTYHQLTQEQLAARLGVQRHTIARWEVGLRACPPYLGLALETVQRELPRAHLKKIRAADPRSAA